MKVRACFLLFGLFANIQSFAYQPKVNPKRVNLELNTVLEFHPKNKQGDIKILDDVQNVITEIRTVIDENGDIKNSRRSSREETLTGFIQEAINIINTYEDTAFDDLVHIVDAEIRKYRYRGCKFSELMKNHEIEKLITAKLDSIKNRATYIKKRKINTLSGVLKYENYDSNVKKIMEYINSLYAHSGDKFRRLLSDLEGYGKSKSSRSNIDLVKIIRNGIRSIIFDHYTNLRVDTRRHLRNQIEIFWQRYKKTYPSEGDNVAEVTPYNTKNSKIIINEVKNLEPDSKKYQKNKINTKPSQHKNKITKKYHQKNGKKRLMNSRKETTDESFEIQEKETRQPSQNTDLVVQPWDEIKLQGPTDVDSLSASFNSIEFYKDQQDKTQQFITIVPGKYSQETTKVTKKPEIIDTLNVMTKTPTSDTIQKKLLWIEQSTGRLPKSVLDKLANKASRSNPDLTGENLNKNVHKRRKNKKQKRWHSKVDKPDKTRRRGYEPEIAKTHKKMYDPQTLRYSELIRDKTNEKIYQQENEKTYGKIYEQAGGNIYEPNDDSLYNNKDEEVERTKGMLWLDLKHNNRPVRYTTEPGKTIKHLARRTANTKKSPAFTRPPRSQIDDTVRMKPTHQTFPQSNSSIGWLHVELPLKAYSKSNNKWFRKYDRYSKTTTKHATSFKEGVTTRNIDIIDDKRHKSQTIPFSYLKDSLKRQNRGINRANDNTEEGSQVKHKIEVKRYVEKSKQLETMSTTDETLKQDTSKTADTADHETVSINYVTVKDSKIKDNDIERRLSLETRFRSGVNMIEDDFKVKEKLLTAETVNKTEFPIEDDYRHYAQTTPFSYLKDIFEGKLNRGINRANEDETKKEEQKKKQLRQRIEEEGKYKPRFQVKRYVEKPKQIETMSTVDDTVKQDKSKMIETADHETDLLNYVTDKDSKIKNYHVTHETAVNKTEFPIEDDNRHNAQTTPFSYLKDLFEGKLNRGINRANEDETKEEEQKKKQLRQRTEEEGKYKPRFQVKRYVEKPKQIETMSTVDDTIKQDKSKMVDTADHKMDLLNYVTDKASKIKDYHIINETAVNKTGFSIEDYKDTYAETNIEDGKKSKTGFKSDFEMLPIDNVVRLNVTGAAKNETDFIIEHVADDDTKNNENRIEKAEKFNTRSRSNENNDFNVTQNKLNTGENDYIQDKDSKNHDTPVMRFRSDNTEVIKTADDITEYKDSKINMENGKKSETNFTLDINVIPNDFNDKPEKTNTRTADIKVDFIEKENDFKSKQDVVDKDHQINQVYDQTSVREARKEKDQIEKDTKQQYIDDVTYFEAKYRAMNDQHGETLTKDNEIKVSTKYQKDDNSFGTQTPTISIASESSSMKGTESTTKASATAVVLTAPTTPKLTANVSIPVVTSIIAPAINENKNKMADKLPDKDVFKSIK